MAVEDQRVFRIDPPVPEEPSLKNDEDINNKAITARAIARKRNTYGMAMGDVLLPEGDTVTAHVTQAITDGFATAGYRVLKTGEAGYDQVTPVTVSIKQYWCWAQPGFIEAKLNCITEIALASKFAPWRRRARAANSSGSVCSLASTANGARSTRWP